MKHHIRQNFVNLGNLYSLRPWHTSHPETENLRRNFVNLGSLYASLKHKEPASWAYFDDGSVFVHPFGWLAHDELQQRMKIAAQFVQNPSLKMQTIRREDPHSQRLILVTKDIRLEDDSRGETNNKFFRLLARNARDGKYSMVLDRYWEHITMTTDSSVSHLISTHSRRHDRWKKWQKVMISDALDTFRGTLIDGTLQPNVWLSNGLCIKNKKVVLEPRTKQKTKTQETKTKSHSKGSSTSTNPSTEAPARPLIRTHFSHTRGHPPAPKIISSFSSKAQQLMLQRAKDRRQEQEPNDTQQQPHPQCKHDQQETEDKSARRLTKCTVHTSLKQASNPDPNPNTKGHHRQQRDDNPHQPKRKANLPNPNPPIHHTITPPFPPEPNSSHSTPSITSTPAPSVLSALRSRTNQTSPRRLRADSRIR